MATWSDESKGPPPVTCPRCSAAFHCSPNGGCWCAAEPVRLPMPEPGAAASCLCPDCLRAAASTPATDKP